MVAQRQSQFSKRRYSVRGVGRYVFSRESGVLLIILLVLMAVVAIVSRGRSATIENASNVVLASATKGILALGQMFVLLSGGIDLSVGGLAILCMMVGSSLMAGAHAFPIGGITIMFLIGAGMGAFNGVLVSRAHVPALITTLGSWQIMNGLAWTVSRGIPITGVPQSIAWIGGGRIGHFPIAGLIFFLLAVLFYFILNHTTFGRSVYATGGNPVSSWLSGINIRGIRFSVYVISGICAALGGLVLTSRLMAGSLSAGTGIELDSIAAVTIGGVSLAGGRGTVVGVIIGVFILGVIHNALNLMAVPSNLQQIAKGAIIITAVAIDFTRRRHE